MKGKTSKTLRFKNRRVSNERTYKQGKGLRPCGGIRRQQVNKEPQSEDVGEKGAARKHKKKTRWRSRKDP